MAVGIHWEDVDNMVITIAAIAVAIGAIWAFVRQVVGSFKTVVRGIINDELAPVRHELNYNHGESLKDHVVLMRREFDDWRREVRSSGNPLL